MKKLMTMLAAVGMAFGLFAEEPEVSSLGIPESFENMAADDPLDTTDGLWSFADADGAATVKAYGSDSTYVYDEEGLGQNTRAVPFGTADQFNYLKVQTTFANPLYRTVSEGEEIGNDVCIDQLVQFTDGVEDDEPTIADGAKIAVWLKATTADDTDTPETNLYVTAAYFNADNSVAYRHYKLADSTVKPGDWCRITVKNLANAFGTYAGFAVYIDGVLATVDTEDENYFYDEEYSLPEISQAAANLADSKQLFVAANDTAVTQVGFAGRGNIDDVSFLVGEPPFAIKHTKAVTITWDTGVTAFKVNGEDADLTDGSYVVEVPVDDIEIEISEIVCPGYNVDDPNTWTVSDNLLWSSTTGNAYKFEFVDDGDAEIEIGVTAKVYVAYVNDVGYESFAEALAAVDAASRDVPPTPATVNFITACTQGGMTFPAETVLYVNGTTWEITVPAGEKVENTVGIEGEKNVTVNGDLDIKGIILSGTPETVLTVTNGTCTILADGLTVGDAAADQSAAFIIGENGQLDTTAGKITLGANGRVVVPTAVTVEEVFTAAQEGKKIVPTPVSGGVQYTLAALDQVEVTVNATGATVTGVATGFYTEGETVTFTVAPAEGFKAPITVLLDGEPLEDEEGEYTFKVGTDAITITVTATACDYVAQIGADGQKFETLAEAVAEANDNDTVNLLKGVTLTSTLEITKAITLDLNDKEISLPAVATVGIDVKAAAMIQNGSIKSALAANVSGSKAINIPNKNVTITSVAIDAAHYEYAIYANCDDACVAAGDKLDWFYTNTAGKFAALVCDSVTITGNGSLFHVEGMTATLNNCSATRDANALFTNAAHHQAAVYSSCNSTTTITGTGTYTHVNALQSGNLGGKIVVNGGSFTGNIKSYMKLGAHSELETLNDYKAVFTLNAGSYIGNIVFEDADSRTLDSFTKGKDVVITNPTGYVWDNGTTLVKIAEVTPEITLSSTEEEYVEGVTTFPTVTVKDYKEGTDYTKEWNELTITAPQPGQTNTYTVTVTMTGKYSGSNTATFKVYKNAAPVVPDIDPTKPSDPMSAEEAAAAAKAINDNPSAYIKAPEAFGTLEPTALATYQTYFTAVVTGSGDNSKVELQLNAVGEAALKATLDGTDGVKKIDPAAIAAAGTATSAEVAAVPGFYYGVKAGNGIGNMSIQNSVPATGTTVTLSLPSFTGSGFYTIVASPTPLQ